LNEVKPRIQALLKNQKAQTLAREEGEKALAEGKSGGTPKLQPAVVVSRDKPQGLQPEELAAGLRADFTNLPAWMGVDLGARGYTVLKVLKVQEREVPVPEQAKQELFQYSQWWASAEGQAYYALLKKRLKVDIKVPQPRASASRSG